jgi:hypothetical protein
MRKFYIYTDKSLYLIQKERDVVCNLLRIKYDIPIEDNFSVDIYNEKKILVAHFEF